MQKKKKKPNKPPTRTIRALLTREHVAHSSDVTSAVGGCSALEFTGPLSPSPGLWRGLMPAGSWVTCRALQGPFMPGNWTENDGEKASSSHPCRGWGCTVKKPCGDL
ncbi:unnamed protein product [Eretmochelys imbricata]